MRHDNFRNYPRGASDRALSVLLTVWPAIFENLREDLVLVGGLAVHLHMLGHASPFGASTVTLDVDLGIALGASAGTYSTLRQTLLSFGFEEKDQQLAREFDGQRILVDFLTEGERAGEGRRVDEILATTFPGIQRALDTRTFHRVQGMDVYGVSQQAEIPVSSLGPLMVLKLNAFDNRRHPKDAFDFLILATQARREAVVAFRREVEAENPGVEKALSTLDLFQESNAEGPLKALAFVRGDGRPLSDEDRRTLESMATMGKILKNGL